MSMKRKCDVCIGCGKCHNVSDASLQVVTESFLKRINGAAKGVPFVLADIGTTTLAMELYNVNGDNYDYQ